MDVVKMIEELRTEREQIEEAILVLERIAHGQGRRSWMTGPPKRRVLSVSLLREISWHREFLRDKTIWARYGSSFSDPLV
jgi:hypothetical protein